MQLVGKKIQRFNTCFLNSPHRFTQVLRLWETSFLIDPCRSYGSVDISKAKHSLPSKRSEYTNEAFHICESWAPPWNTEAALWFEMDICVSPPLPHSDCRRKRPAFLPGSFTQGWALPDARATGNPGEEIQTQAGGACAPPPSLVLSGRKGKACRSNWETLKGLWGMPSFLLISGWGRPTKRRKELAVALEPQVGFQPGEAFLPGVTQEVQGKVTRGLGALD